MIFKDLYEEEKHSDVTLVCVDQTQFSVFRAQGRRILVLDGGERNFLKLIFQHNFPSASAISIDTNRFYENNECSESSLPMSH